MEPQSRHSPTHMAKNVTTKYVLSRRMRRVLTEYVNGDITLAEAARQLKDRRQNVQRYVAEITKHAARTGKLDFGALIKHY